MKLDKIRNTLTTDYLKVNFVEKLGLRFVNTVSPSYHAHKFLHLVFTFYSRKNLSF